MNLAQNIEFYCNLKGVKKNQIIDYLRVDQSSFYRKMKNNKWLWPEVIKIAEFFGVPLLDFLQQKTSLSYAMEAPAPYAAKSKEAQIEGLKKEVAYLKKIVELMEKSKRLK